VIGTYAAVMAVCVSALALGQAAICLCGERRWSWLAPGVGLALLCALCWGTVRLPGDGIVSAIVVLLLTIVALAYLWGRVERTGEALAAGWPVALVALLAASLPFAVEGHFGILGTSFNPDMSQHLLTAARLAEGHGSQLLNQGYPLGPHAIVVALNKGLGVGLVQGFSGLTVAVAILACLTALAAFAELPLLPRTAGALLVGLAYVVASYFAQGAFKETMQTLFLLAFVLALRESNRSWADLPLRFVPAALVAVGSVYTYSFPGLIWLGGAAVLWLIASAAGGADLGDRHSPNASGGGTKSGTGPAARALGLAFLTFFVLIAPEIGRMIEFHSFETFDPNGPGLGNLFGQISPFEVLGIWPSGDFRLAPGDGAVPAAAYYLGIVFALVLLIYGVAQLWRRRERAILAGLAAAALAYIAARVGGTPYTAAKAIEIAAPLVALSILLPLLGSIEWRFPLAMREQVDIRRLVLGGATVLFVAAAGICSLLALANAPVGPSSFTPTLSEFRKQVGEGPTLVVAPPRLLEDEHGIPFLSWELRGGRVCIEAEPKPDRVGSVTYIQPPPQGVRFVVTEGDGSEPPFADLRIRRVGSPYVLWEAMTPTPGKSPCPLIAERQARQGPAR
jgi:hypothetical protein